MKYLLFPVIATLILGLGFLLYAWPLGKHYSFSQHAAQTKSASIFYALLFLVTMPLLALYSIFWFVPTFHASGHLGWLVVLAGVSQIACTFVPERGSQRQIMAHRWLAGISGGLFLLAVVCVTMADIGDVSRIIVLAGGAVMVSVLAWMLINKRKTMTYRMQIVYYSGFLLPLAWLTY